MGKRKELWDNPVVRHRLLVGGYAKITGNISLAARKFNHDRKTIRRYVKMYEEFERTGDLRVFLNRPRGNSHRTPEWIEEAVEQYYLEEGVKRTCPHIARLLEEEKGVKLTRQTVYNILRRRGVWVSPREQKEVKPIVRFEEEVPNATWQAERLVKNIVSI